MSDNRNAYKSMKTTTVAIGDIKPNPNNPRHIKDDKFKKLVASIRDFPQMLELRPIVVDADGMVLGGNMRLKACQTAGLKEVPVIYADQLTEDQKREFIIKDNVGFGDWDWDVLANEWDVSDLNDWGLDVPAFSEEDDIDLDTSKEAAEIYLNNSIRQIILYYEAEMHTKIIARMQAIEEDFGISEDNSALFIKLLEYYENNRN